MERRVAFSILRFGRYMIRTCDPHGVNVVL